MLVNPKYVEFESMQDIVDYVSRGFMPPSKKNFHQVIEKVNLPDSVDSIENKIGNEVVISEELIDDENRDCLAIALQRVYTNRVRNRNIAIGTIVGTTGLILLAMLIGGSSKKEDVEKDSPVTYILEDDDGGVIHLTEF